MKTSSMQGFIYFLRDPVLPTAVKIGWSGDPVTRCRAINNRPRLKRNEVALVAPEILAAIDLCAVVHGGAA